MPALDESGRPWDHLHTSCPADSARVLLGGTGSHIVLPKRPEGRVPIPDPIPGPYA